MFWFKNKKEVIDATPRVEDKPIILAQPNNLNSLTLRRNVLDWKDKHITNIELHLRREITSLMQAVDYELDKLSVIDSTFKIRKIHANIIQPLTDEWTQRESSYLLDEAQKELLSIHGLVLDKIDHNLEIGEHNSNTHFTDAATAASLGITGIAAIPAFASASAVSTSGLIGLFGVTTLSLPIAATGILIIGTLFAFSGFKMSSIKEKAIKRYREQLHLSITKSVLGDVDNTSPSLSEQLQIRILTASNYIINEVDE